MMDMQSLLFDFYWQYFKVLLIDVHKENITFFVMINDKVGLSTAYSCKHQYSIHFPGSLFFKRYFPMYGLFLTSSPSRFLQLGFYPQ